MHYDTFVAPARKFLSIEGQGMIVEKDAPINDPGEAEDEDEDEDED